MHDFKIVATKEKNGIYLCAVPHQWENNQILRWPEHLTTSSRESLRSDPAHIPEDTWAEYPCIVKCSGIRTFKEALQMEKQLTKCIDSDAEEAVFNSMMVKKQRVVKQEKKRTNHELTDRNDLFDNLIISHHEQSMDKSMFQENKKIKIISQETITPAPKGIFTPTVLFSGNNVNNVPSECKTLLVHDDGTVQTVDVPRYSSLEECINPVQVNDDVDVEIKQIKLELTNIKTEMVAIKETIKHDFNKINVNLDRIYKMISEIHVPILKNTEINDIPKENFLQDFNFPLTSCDEIQKLENQIRSNEEFKAQLITFLSKTGGTSREEDGMKVAYKVVDQVFSPNVLTNYTWTGVSRGNNKAAKKSFQILEGILNVFFEVLSLADSRHTKQKNSKIFKDAVLKYASKRSLRKRSKHGSEPRTEQPEPEINDETLIGTEQVKVMMNDDVVGTEESNEADAEESD